MNVSLQNYSENAHHRIRTSFPFNLLNIYGIKKKLQVTVVEYILKISICQIMYDPFLYVQLFLKNLRALCLSL
jgi:hypothetical protein